MLRDAPNIGQERHTAWDAATRYRLLLKINNAIVNQTTRESLFRALASELRQIFHYDRFSINLYDAATRSLSYFATAEGIPLAGIYNQDRPIAKGVLANVVIRSREPLIIPDLTCQTYITSADNMLSAGLRATMIFPMIVRDKVLGTIHFSFVQAPPDMDELAGFLAEMSTQAAIAVDNMLSHTTLKEMNENLRHQKRFLQSQAEDEWDPDQLVFASSAMQSVMAQAEMVAATDASVLISGETGTGKDFLAHRLHLASHRRDALLVKVSCPALASSLFESELFGHAKGAFTGANARRAGRFEMAAGGTVFLDEIGDLPLPLQAKILHVLQDRAFERVGESRPISVDFRVIAATNCDLETAVREGTFRSDLYYRLNTVRLHMPPLRERMEDIPLLLSRLNDSQSRTMHRAAPLYPPAVMGLLCRYPWPGNIRELRNLVSRMLILRSGQTVTEQDIQSHLFTLDQGEQSHFPTLDEAEREHIQRALTRACGVLGGPGGAAALLGVPRSTLQYRMKRLGIPPEAGRRRS